MRAVLVALTFLGLSACAAGDLAAVERLDGRTAVHATLMPEPWIYARESPMLAAHARDYLNLGVLQANRAGSRTYWLGVVAWSTLDRPGRGGEAATDAPPGRIRLGWSGSALELSPDPGGRAAVGLAEPAFTDGAIAFVEAWYPLSSAQLARLAAAPPEEVRLLDDGGGELAYAAWRARAGSLAAFVAAVGPPAVERR